MTSYRLWVFAHIMLLVYWLGADLGVFLLARAAKRTTLSFGERVFSLRMALVIDFVPRLCFALMFPVGLHVTGGGGFAQVPAWAYAAAWTVSAAWVLLLFAMARSEGQPRAATLNRLNLGLQTLLLVVLGYVALTSVAGAGPFPAGWLAWKVLLFALIFALSIGIDFAFRPIVPAFARLASEGSRPDIEATITGATDHAIRWVLALYALIAGIAFLGVVKPF